MALRIGGATWVEIAAQMGLRSERSAADLYYRTLEEGVREAADETKRNEEITRLDRLMRRWWPDAIAMAPANASDDDREKIDARSERAMKQLKWVLDMRIRLQGLYRPVQIELPDELPMTVSLDDVWDKLEALREQRRVAGIVDAVIDATSTTVHTNGQGHPELPAAG